MLPARMQTGGNEYDGLHPPACAGSIIAERPKPDMFAGSITRFVCRKSRGHAPEALSVALAVMSAVACADGDSAVERDTSRVPVGANAPLPAEGARATAQLDAEDGQWTRPAKSYSSIRYSQLTEIAASNVARLAPAWTFSTGILRGHEEAPLVVDNTLFLITPYPNILYALDLTRPGAPLKWKYEPEPAAAAQGVACCDVVNRGAAYADGRIIFNTLDNHVIAVDARTGEELWKTKVGDINKGETMTMAPLIVKGRALVGNSGGEMGVRGWLKSIDITSGRVVWTAHSTGPDADVLIGSRFKPFYEKERGRDLGVTSWPGTKWQVGGGTVWGWISYDPELDLIYYGTGNPGPW